MNTDVIETLDTLVKFLMSLKQRVDMTGNLNQAELSGVDGYKDARFPGNPPGMQLSLCN